MEGRRTGARRTRPRLGTKAAGGARQEGPLKCTEKRPSGWAAGEGGGSHKKMGKGYTALLHSRRAAAALRRGADGSARRHTRESDH